MCGMILSFKRKKLHSKILIFKTSYMYGPIAWKVGYTDVNQTPLTFLEWPKLEFGPSDA